MDVLWDAEGWLTAREVASRLHHERDLAYTTVLTVLERLERKGFVQRQRAARAHRYRAADAREAVVAEAMLEALGTADDRSLALVRFVGSVSPEEAEILRRALAVQLDGDDATPAAAAIETGDGVTAGGDTAPSEAATAAEQPATTQAQSPTPGDAGDVTPDPAVANALHDVDDGTVATS